MATSSRVSAGVVLVVTAVALATAGGAFAGGVAAQSGPSIGFSGVPGSITVGDTATATVGFADVNDSDGVGSFTVNVTYDSNAVSVSASGADDFEVQTATPEAGVLRVTGFTDQYPGPNESETLFSLSVTGDNASESVPLGLEVETFTDADGNDIAVSTGNATLAVEAASSGDGGDGGDGGGGGQGGGGADGEVEIRDRTLLNESVTGVEPVVVAVDLTNFDPVEGQMALTLTADGSTVIGRTVTVGASTRRTVYLRTRFGTPGTYALSVNGVSVGSVTVEADQTPTPTPTETRTPGGMPTPTPTETPTPTGTPTSTPEEPRDGSSTVSEDGNGFGLAVTLLAVGLTLLLLGARHRS